MKRYWKNMYGFRLTDDEKEEPAFYVNVVFGSSFDDSFNSSSCW